MVQRNCIYIFQSIKVLSLMKMEALLEKIISASQGRKELNISDLFSKNMAFYTYSGNNGKQVLYLQHQI